MTNEEQSFRTKKMLSEALKTLIKKKNFDKISVSELIRICNINRNTFYYHFDNIYDLLEWTLEQDFFNIINDMDNLNLEDLISFMLDYFEKNIQVLEWAYDFMNYSARSKYFGSKMKGVMQEKMKALQQEMNLEVADSDVDFFCSFFSDSLVSSFYHFVKGEVSYSREEYIGMIIFTLRISLRQFIIEKGKPIKSIKSNEEKK